MNLAFIEARKPGRTSEPFWRYRIVDLVTRMRKRGI